MSDGACWVGCNDEIARLDTDSFVDRNDNDLALVDLAPTCISSVDPCLMTNGVSYDRLARFLRSCHGDLRLHQSVASWYRCLHPCG